MPWLLPALLKVFVSTESHVLQLQAPSLNTALRATSDAPVLADWHISLSLISQGLENSFALALKKTSYFSLQQEHM